MKYIDEFRDAALAQQLIKRIRYLSAGRNIRLMEICGSHTVAIYKAGIRTLFPQIDLVSGPGCPVCVTSTADLDRAVKLAQSPDTILATFGDMIRVPGSTSSLQKEMSQGADIRVVYSSFDSLTLARDNPDKRVVFLAIGFETTAPAIAATILAADKHGVDNFAILCLHKLVPPAMRALLEGDQVHLDAFICPGHVSTIIGSKPYDFIAQQYHLPAVIAGFEPIDILQTLHMILSQICENQSIVEIQYSRIVKPEGNPLAIQMLQEVFQPSDAQWRGLGLIPESGLTLREQFKRYDAARYYDVSIEECLDPSGCECGHILKGLKKPSECPLFKTVCSPSRPVGPCMVSSEGSCAAAYKYG
ncbi:MAG: hydrogenase formation protein HypD [bacterium]